MTIKKPGKVTLYPVGSFDPLAPSVNDLLAAPGVEIADFTSDGDVALIDCGDGIEAVYVKDVDQIARMKGDPWFNGLYRTMNYPSGPRGAIGRFPNELAVLPGRWIMKDVAGRFKVINPEKFDELRETIIRIATLRAREERLAERKNVRAQSLR